MDNLKLPAQPQPGVYYPSNDSVSFNTDPDYSGFTKLELASLMVMQGMLSNSLPLDQGYEPFHHMQPERLASIAVRYAVSVLEEANK